MSKITQNYIEARRDGIKWLNSQKRDYSTGVNILTRSGYKGFVAARLARQGEKPHTREKLEYEIRQMIKVWYHPDDPRFEDVDSRGFSLIGASMRVRRTNSPPILR